MIAQDMQYSYHYKSNVWQKKDGHWEKSNKIDNEAPVDEYREPVDGDSIAAEMREAMNELLNVEEHKPEPVMSSEDFELQEAAMKALKDAQSLLKTLKTVRDSKSVTNSCTTASRQSSQNKEPSTLSATKKALQAELETVKDPSECSPTHSFMTESCPSLITRVQTLSLKLLGGKNLPAQENAILKVYVNDTAELATIRMNEVNAAWGGECYTFPFEADVATSHLLFEWHAYGLGGKVRVPVASLVAATSPEEDNEMINHWIKRAAGGGNAQIQLRLTSAPEEEELKPRKTTSISVSSRSRQAPKPKGTPVILNIYDVPKASQGGLYHAAIEIYGQEYSFGGTQSTTYDGTGIFTNLPTKCPMYTFRESKHLGDCELTKAQVDMLVLQMQPQWQAQSYQLKQKNGCSFAAAFARELGMEDRVDTLLQKKLDDEKKVAPDSSLSGSCGFFLTLSEAAVWYAEFFLPKAPKIDEKAAEKTDSKSEPQAVGRMLDHAMATRIQRSFRLQKKQ